MTASKPLSYEGLKTVLQHLGANKRFHTVQLCPSLGKSDKVIPLKLHSLVLGGQYVLINATKYEAGAYRHYPAGVEIPELHQSENKNGCVSNNLDKFGTWENMEEKPLSPGDIYIDEIYELTDDDDEIDQQTNRIAYFENKFHKTSEDLKYLKEAQAKLQPYLNKRNNVLPEYEILTQVTVTSPNSTRFERFKKILQHHEVINYLIRSLFGGRAHSVRVKCFSFGWDIKVLRSPPVDLKFRIRRLRSDWQFRDNLGALSKFFDNENLPLEVLETEISEQSDLSHWLEKSASKLFMRNWTLNEHLLATIPKLTNHELHMKGYQIDSDRNDLLVNKIIENWIEHGREIGCRFLAEGIIDNRFRFMRQLKAIMERFNGKKTGIESISIPLHYDREIHVVYELEEDTAENEEWDATAGLISITVVAITSS